MVILYGHFLYGYCLYILFYKGQIAKCKIYAGQNFIRTFLYISKFMQFNINTVKTYKGEKICALSWNFVETGPIKLADLDLMLFLFDPIPDLGTWYRMLVKFSQ
jgi:hypothetical protein